MAEPANEMTSGNLGVVLGSAIMGIRDGSAHVAIVDGEFTCVELFISHPEWLFDCDCEAD